MMYGLSARIHLGEGVRAPEMCDAWAFCTLVYTHTPRGGNEDARSDMCDTWAFFTLVYTHTPWGGNDDARDVCIMGFLHSSVHAHT